MWTFGDTSALHANVQRMTPAGIIASHGLVDRAPGTQSEEHRGAFVSSSMRASISAACTGSPCERPLPCLCNSCVAMPSMLFFKAWQAIMDKSFFSHNRRFSVSGI